jgi:hypothetical protein
LIDEAILLDLSPKEAIWELPEQFNEEIIPRMTAEIILIGLRPKGKKDYKLYLSKRLKDNWPFLIY